MTKLQSQINREKITELANKIYNFAEDGCMSLFKEAPIAVYRNGEKAIISLNRKPINGINSEDYSMVQLSNDYYNKWRLDYWYLDMCIQEYITLLNQCLISIENDPTLMK